MVTKEMFQKVFHKGIGDLAILINKSFVGIESRMAKQEDLLELTRRVDKLEKYAENRFDDLARELREIRHEIKEVDTRADVVDLQLRVNKLEKKMGM